MGASASLDLRPEEVRELEDLTHYEPKEIKTLYKRFRRIDRSGRGTISVEDLLMIPEISMNPLASRLVKMFERDMEDRINFRAFAAGLAIFSSRARPALKCRTVFKLFDVDEDGFISEADLRACVDLMVGKTISPSNAAAIVAHTLSSADVDGDGRISFDDFAQSMASVSWDMLSVPVRSSAKWEGQDPALASAASFTRPGHT